MLVSNLILGGVILYAVIRRMVFIFEAMKEKNNSKLKAELFFMVLTLLISGVLLVFINTEK